MEVTNIATPPTEEIFNRRNTSMTFRKSGDNAWYNIFGYAPHDEYTELNETFQRYNSLSSEVLDTYKWMAYIIPFLAVFLNGLSIAVLLQRRIGKAPVSNFLIALAVCDTFAVTAVFYMAYLGHGWWPLTDIGCKLSVFATSVGRICSIWLTVFFSAERLISVKYVFKSIDIITSFNINMIIMVLIGLVMIEQAFIWVWVEKIDFIEPTLCFPKSEELQKRYFITMLIMNHLCNFILPCIAVAIMNAIIVSTVRKSVYIPGNSCRLRKSSGTKRLTTMLVMVSTTTFILLLPETLSKIIDAAIVHSKPTWLTSFTILAEIISYLNHTSHFFFYVLAGREFRADFVDMIRCRKPAVIRRQKAIRRGQLCTRSHTSLVGGATSTSAISGISFQDVPTSDA